eukprot:COSAG06_NODE_333_length_17341_cov_7.601032_16_plen_115_part_00
MGGCASTSLPDNTLRRIVIITVIRCNAAVNRRCILGSLRVIFQRSLVGCKAVLTNSIGATFCDEQVRAGALQFEGGGLEERDEPRPWLECGAAGCCAAVAAAPLANVCSILDTF